MVKKQDVLYLEPYIIEKRRYLHQHPETGFEVKETHDYIAKELTDLGIETILHVGKNSLIGLIHNGKGPIIGLRADMDALPLEEQNDELSYKSIHKGIMHACGHDSHSAMLLGAASYLQTHKDLWKGTVKLIFQEAEEGPNPGGAYEIVRSNLLNDVDSFYAFHVSSEFESGKIATKKNATFASADTIKMTLHGKGCHAAYPHLGIDPIIMQAEVILGLQLIRSRILNPLEPSVITIAKVVSGTTHNIIPDIAYLEGTVRTFSVVVREKIKLEIEKVLKSVTEKYGGTYDYSYIYEYDPVINTPSEVDYIEKVVHQTLGNNVFTLLDRPSMGAEDFSRYIQLKQGCMMWLGTRKDESTSFGLHHPKFNLDEKALLNGSLLFINLVLAYEKG
ncbi:MAG: amidohydrolase [Firmicutes bacterium]|nr:amidohydrolase [Bacillota bacterium]